MEGGICDNSSSHSRPRPRLIITIIPDIRARLHLHFSLELRACIATAAAAAAKVGPEVMELVVELLEVSAVATFDTGAIEFALLWQSSNLCSTVISVIWTSVVSLNPIS